MRGRGEKRSEENAEEPESEIEIEKDGSSARKRERVQKVKGSKRKRKKEPGSEREREREREDGCVCVYVCKVVGHSSSIEDARDRDVLKNGDKTYCQARCIGIVPATCHLPTPFQSRPWRASANRQARNTRKVESSARNCMRHPKSPTIIPRH